MSTTTGILLVIAQVATAIAFYFQQEMIKKVRSKIKVYTLLTEDVNEMQKYMYNKIIELKEKDIPIEYFKKQFLKYSISEEDFSKLSIPKKKMILDIYKETGIDLSYYIAKRTHPNVQPDKSTPTSDRKPYTERKDKSTPPPSNL